MSNTNGGALQGGQLQPAGAADPGAILAAAYSDYIKFLDASPRTVQAYAASLRQLFAWLDRQGITQPTRADILAYRDELRQRCRPATIQNYIAAARLFFQWTAQAGIYPNIADHIKGAKVDSGHKKDYLNAEQVKDILSSIDTATARGKRDFALFVLMITGGLRDIEASRANIEDLRQRSGATVLYLQGKGREDRNEYIKIVPAVEKALRAYLRTRTNATGRQPLFASMSNNSKGQRLSPRSISAIIKARLIAAGYNSDRLTAHSLRHTAVTLSLLGGLPLEEVQQFARHKNISTTQIYAHNLNRAENRSEDTIAGAIFGN